MMCSFGLVSTARLQLMLDQANTNTPFNPFHPLQFLFSAKKKRHYSPSVSLFKWILPYNVIKPFLQTAAISSYDCLAMIGQPLPFLRSELGKDKMCFIWDLFLVWLACLLACLNQEPILIQETLVSYSYQTPTALSSVASQMVSR